MASDCLGFFAGGPIGKGKMETPFAGLAFPNRYLWASSTVRCSMRKKDAFRVAMSVRSWSGFWRIQARAASLSSAKKIGTGPPGSWPANLSIVRGKKPCRTETQ